MLDLDLQDLARWFLERGIVRISEDPKNDFVLRNVGRDPVYFDLRLAEDSRLGQGITPQMGKAIAAHLEFLIRQPGIPHFDCITGIPRGGDIFAEVLASRFNQPAVRMSKLEDGTITGFLTKPLPPEGSAFLLIENITTSGTSVLKVVNFLQTRGYQVACAASVIDRESGAKDVLGVWGIRLESIFQMERILNFYINEQEVLIEPCKRAIQHAKTLRTPPTSGPSH